MVGGVVSNEAYIEFLRSYCVRRLFNRLHAVR